MSWLASAAFSRSIPRFGRSFFAIHLAATCLRGMPLASCSAREDFAPPYRAIAIRRARACFSAARRAYSPTTSRRRKRRSASTATMMARGSCWRNRSVVEGMKDWIIKHSDGKADVALVERWTTIPLNRGMIHFYLPSVAREWAAATFFCQGTERGSPSNVCERIGKSAIDLGVITSLDTISSNDKAELLATLQRPKPTAFAAIDDLARIPLNDQRGIEEYRRFLRAPTPRAFAVSPDRANWAWNARHWDAPALALSRCAERAGQTCHLYAVDEDVVWSP